MSIGGVICWIARTISDDRIVARICKSQPPSLHTSCNFSYVSLMFTKGTNLHRGLSLVQYSYQNEVSPAPIRNLCPWAKEATTFLIPLQVIVALDFLSAIQMDFWSKYLWARTWTHFSLWCNIFHTSFPKRDTFMILASQIPRPSKCFKVVTVCQLTWFQVLDTSSPPQRKASSYFVKLVTHISRNMTSCFVYTRIVVVTYFTKQALPALFNELPF